MPASFRTPNSTSAREHYNPTRSTIVIQPECINTLWRLNLDDLPPCCPRLQVLSSATSHARRVVGVKLHCEPSLVSFSAVHLPLN
jgi:hypothetical protein